MSPLKYLFLALVLCLGLSTLTSCNLWDDKEKDLETDDVILVDWNQAELCITVEDAYGNDLLDTLSNLCIVDDITVDFQGETLKVRKNCRGEAGEMILADGTTRKNFAFWYGLCLIHEWPLYGKRTEKFMLYFGQIDANRDHDEDIVINWGNGKTSTIHYHCSDFIETKEEISRNLWYSVDGKIQTSSFFHFVL